MPRLQAAALCSILAFPSPCCGYFWNGKNGDALRTGTSSYVVPSDLSAGPTWSWEAPNNDIVRSHPLIDNYRNIYITTVGPQTLSLEGLPGSILKFNASGHVLWQYNATSSIPGGPALLDGFLYFSTFDGHVGALDMETGVESWLNKVAPGTGSDTTSLAAAGGYVIAPVRSATPMEIPVPKETDPLGPGTYVEPSGGPSVELVALDAKTGDVRWRFMTDTVMYNSLAAVVDGSVVVADTNGRTYRINLASGELIWKHESAEYRNYTGMSTGGAVVGPNRIVYVTSNVGLANGAPGRLSAYALESGELLWRQDVEFSANNAPAVGPIGPGGVGPLAVVIVIGENPGMAGLHPPGNGSKLAKVLAFDAETGERLAWEHKLTWPHHSAAGDTIVPLHICLPDDSSNPAIGGDGTVYFGFEDGHLYALRDSDGDGRLSAGEVSISTYDGGNAYQGSPGLAPNMLVATPCNGVHVFLGDVA